MVSRRQWERVRSYIRLGREPQILLEDADLAVAIPIALATGFVNSGQSCVAGTRLLVPESRLDEALVQLKDHIETFKVAMRPARSAYSASRWRTTSLRPRQRPSSATIRPPAMTSTRSASPRSSGISEEIADIDAAGRLIERLIAELAAQGIALMVVSLAIAIASASSR
jgi:Aldehyde dehydrogenase family